MNKTAIKNFAIWARNKLIADISYRAGLMGITADDIQNALPQSTGTTEFYDIGTSEPYAIAGDAVKQRRHLVELIRAKERETNYKTAYKYVLEEVAYTWFNRLIAVRFMEVNDYLPSHIRVLSSDSGKMEPDLVTTPFDADLSFTRDEEQQVYQLKQENKIDDLFRILFIKQCNVLNEILPALFEKTSDYTELLLNLSVIDQDGVVYRLVHDIPEEDFDVERGGQVEIIGWLYQYYNTELKDETFLLLKEKIKISKERVPAATQIFTPDWIVRYMVENSLGRIWMDGHRNDELKKGWKYYLDEPEQDVEVQVELERRRSEYQNLNLEDIKVIDPCMGSGHILVYAFDVLMQIYENAGYGQRDAARSILENNLYGLDIDDRAFQMAYFAIIMKARQYNRRIMNGKCKPNVYSIQESNGINRDQLKYFGAGLNEFETNNAITQMNGLLDTFRDAKEFGSILKVEQYDWELLKRYVLGINTHGQLSFNTYGIEETKADLISIILQAEVISQKYDLVITNPPYMGSGNMGGKLLAYIKDNYPDSKADLSTVFMEKTLDMCKKNGYMAMINIPVWMFISSFEQLRKSLLSNNTIVNLLHLGRGIFGADFGTTSFVFNKDRIQNYKGKYYRLFKKQSIVGSPESIENEFVKRTGEYITKQEEMLLLPGNPMAYWISEKMAESFNGGTMDTHASARIGLATGNNDYYLRLWYEVAHNNIGFNFTRERAKESGKRWFPYNKGGEYRKWYGNRDYVVNWFNDGIELQTKMHPSGTRIWAHNFNLDYIFKKNIAWSDITISSSSFRAFEEGFIFDSCGTSAFVLDDKEYYSILGYLNTKMVNQLTSILNPTIHFTPGDFARLPFKDMSDSREMLDTHVKSCVEICRDEWDSFETSWDFKIHPLLKYKSTGSLNDAFTRWLQHSEKQFVELKQNEEKINQIFIDSYDLSGEMSCEVKNSDIALRRVNLQEGIRSLLSYAIGCMFGRYSLDCEGLVYAGGEWDDSRYIKFTPDADDVIPITDEEYLEDDIVSRLCSWLKVVYGESTLEENLDFIAKAIGNKGSSSRQIIRNYFLNDFFKDHCQTYSVTGSGKRPIYWLFDSGKQNGFKALIYLHRYNADTIGNLRIDYLHRMQRIYESEISRMQDMIDHSTSAREVAQATKRREKLQKQLKECREYDEKLAHLALSRIELDLDDGVKKNYRKIQTANDGKFYEVLADSKNIMAKE